MIIILGRFPGVCQGDQAVASGSPERGAESGKKDIHNIGVDDPAKSGMIRGPAVAVTI